MSSARIDISLSVNDRVLLHLADYMRFKDRWEAPFETTQEGMGRVLGLRQTHVSRAMQKLKELGYVDEITAHVKGGRRKRKVYFCSKDGVEYVRNMMGEIGSRVIPCRTAKGRMVKKRLHSIIESLRGRMSTLEMIELVSGKDGIDETDLQTAGKEKHHERSVFDADEAPIVERFFGRTDEIEQIINWLESDSIRIIFVHGLAGIGKSSLISRVVEGYRNRRHVFWHRIHQWDDLRSVLHRTSEFLTLSGMEEMGKDMEDKGAVEGDVSVRALAEKLSKLEAILVFDDFQKAAGEIRALFGSLFPAITGESRSRLVVVSRSYEPFYEYSEVLKGNKVGEMHLTGLDEDSSKEMMEAAEITGDGFRQLYEITGGHPLYLELVKDLGASAPSPDFKTFVEREIFNKLSQAEKRMLRVASVHRYPVDSAGLLLDDELEYGVLSGLVAKSLLQRKSDMYDIHDLIREFFYGSLTRTSRMNCHGLAAGHYQGMLLKGRMTGNDEREEFLFIEMLYHLSGAHEHAKAIERAIEGSGKYVFRRYGELLSIIGGIDEDELESDSRAELQTLKGDCHLHLGEADRALEYYEENLRGLGKGRERGDKIAEIYTRIGNVYGEKGDLTRTIEFHRKSMKLLEKYENRKGLAKIYNNLGVDFRRKGDYEGALYYFNKGLELLEAMNERIGLSITYDNVARTQLLSGELAAARRNYRKSLEMAGKARYRIGILRAYYHLGRLASRKGDAASALDHLGRASELIRRLSDRQKIRELSVIAAIPLEIGDILHERGQYSDALFHFNRSLKLIMDAKGEYSAIAGRSERSGRELESDRIHRIMEESPDGGSSIRTSEVGTLGNILFRRARAYTAMEDHENAVRDNRLAGEVFEFVGEHRNAIKADLALGSAYLSLEKFDKAMAVYGKSLRELLEEGEEIGAISALSNIGKVHEKRGEREEAARCYEKSLARSGRAGYDFGIRTATENLKRLKGR